MGRVVVSPAAFAIGLALMGATGCVGDVPAPPAPAVAAAADSGTPAAMPPAMPSASSQADGGGLLPGRGDAQPDPPYSAAADPTMRAYWRFEDPPMDFLATDASGQLAAGMVAGNATFAPGKYGNGLHVGDGWVNAGAITAIADWTIAFWLRSEAVEIARTAIDMNFEAVSGIGPLFGETANGVFVEVGSGGLNGQRVKISLTTAFAANEWHHVAATWTKSTLTGYFDGVSSGSAPALQPPTRFDNIQLGRGNTDLVATRFKGTLDEVRIYGRALSAGEMKDVFDGKR